MSPQEMLLEAVVLATIGELFVDHENMLELSWPPEVVSQLKAVVKARSDYPALRAVGSRKRVPTNNDSLYYAYLRSTPSGD